VWGWLQQVNGLGAGGNPFGGGNHLCNALMCGVVCQVCMGRLGFLGVGGCWACNLLCQGDVFAGRLWCVKIGGLEKK